MRSSRQIIQMSFNIRLGHCSRQGVDQAAGVEQQQGRHAQYIESCRDHRVLVHVQLCYFDHPGELSGQLIEDRRRHFTGLAPWRPAVQHDRSGKRHDLLFKVCIGDHYRQGRRRRQRRFAFGADRFVGQPVSGHPVARSAVVTSQYAAVVVHLSPVIVFVFLIVGRNLCLATLDSLV